MHSKFPMEKIQYYCAIKKQYENSTDNIIRRRPFEVFGPYLQERWNREDCYLKIEGKRAREDNGLLM